MNPTPSNVTLESTMTMNRYARACIAHERGRQPASAPSDAGNAEPRRASRKAPAPEGPSEGGKPRSMASLPSRGELGRARVAAGGRRHCWPRPMPTHRR